MEDATKPESIPRSSPAITTDDVRIQFQEAKRATKTKNMRGLVEKVGEALGKAHPNIKDIELHYEMRGVPNVKDGLEGAGGESGNNGKLIPADASESPKASEHVKAEEGGSEIQPE